LDLYKANSLRERKLKTYLTIFFPVFFIALSATFVIWYESYVNGNAGEINGLFIIVVGIMVGILLIPPFFALSKSRMPRWTMMPIIISLFALWEIAFDLFALMFFPILIDILILDYVSSKSVASNI